MSELGRYVADEHGAVLVFHTHADSHVGHAGGDRALPRRHRPRDRPAVPRHRPRRVLRRRQPASSSATTRTASGTSTSSRSTRRSGPASREERLGFAPAVRLGVMVEPPLGEPGHAGRARGARRPSTGTCSASSSRTCTRVPSTSRCPIAHADPRVLRDLRPRRRTAARPTDRPGIRPASQERQTT